MLIDFTVENFRSIRDAKKLSMVASSSEELPQNAIDVPELGLRVLKSAAIYGANASGKTNLLQAMHAVASLVRPPLEPRVRWVEVLPVFVLDANKRKLPTNFNVRILVEAVLYEYSLSAQDGLIQSERLVAYPSGRPQEWFRREGKRFEFGKSHLKGQKQKLQELVTEELTFLAVAATFGHPQLALVSRCLTDSLSLRVGWGNPSTEKCLKDKEFLSWTNKLISSSDIGIGSVEIRYIEPVEQDSGKLVRELGVFFRHGNDGRSVLFGLDKESQGTQNFFFMLAPLYDVLKQGQVMVVDEFAALHSELSHEIVRLFHDPNTNPRGAQLIFATHDTSLLSSQLMRRDQIWFTEKDRAGATDLYSLQDFKGVQADEDFGKGYLRGRYGAIPFFGKLEFPPQGAEEEKPAASGLETAGSVAPGKEIDSDRT